VLNHVDYTARPGCEKCGDAHVDLSYRRHAIQGERLNFNSNLQDVVPVEYLACTCRRCGFKWKMAVKNPF